MAKDQSEDELLGGARRIETTQARKSFRDIVDEAYAAGRRVVITRHSRPVAALVAIKDFLRLREHDLVADARLAERRGKAGDSSDAVSLEGLIGSLESAEAGGVHIEGEQLKFGHVASEQLARDVVLQYIESAEFLYRAQQYVIELIAEASNHQKTELTAHEAHALKRALLAELIANGLRTHEFA